MGSTARAIQYSVAHVSIGIAVGSLIEGVLPSVADGSSLTTTVFETLVQAGLNGAALVLCERCLGQDDPTAGLPFSMALFYSQPEFLRRIDILSSVIRGQVSQAVQRTVPQLPAV